MPTERLRQFAELYEERGKFLVTDVTCETIDRPVLQGRQLVNIVRLRVSNTAPHQPGGPWVVFFSYGSIRPEIRRDGEDRGVAGAEKPLLAGPRRDEDALTTEPGATSFLFPGEVITWDLEIPPAELGRYEFTVKLALSVRSFFSYTRRMQDSPDAARVAALNALKFLNEYKIHEPVDLTFEALELMGRDPSVQNVARLRGTVDIASEALEAESRLRRANVPSATKPISDHFRRFQEHRNEVSRALQTLKQALAGGDASAVRTASDGFRQLRTRSLELDQLAVALQLRYGITDQEAGFRYADRR